MRSLPLLLFLLSAAGFAEQPPTPGIDEIVKRMMAADAARIAALEKFTGTRKYSLVNYRFNKRGEVVARMEYTRPGVKSFEVVSESGSGIIRNRVLRKMIEAEAEASRGDMRDRSRITPQNYEFGLVGTDTCEGKPCFAVSLKPKTENKFLMRGKIWVDAAEYAIVRVEGTPAKNPSFWIKDTKVVQQYAKHGDFWLPLSNRSTTEARMFGKTDVTIEYSDYQITGAMHH